MNLDDLPPVELMWEGKFVRALRRGKWEYASRARNIGAVVILAEHDGQGDPGRAAARRSRLPLHRASGRPGRRQGPDATIESTAIKELEEETGFTADRVERLGEFYASPGMLSEGFTLVRAHGVRRIGEGGGDENEDIKVHLVARADIPNFIEQKRAEGFGVDAKLLLLLNF